MRLKNALAHHGRLSAILSGIAIGTSYIPFPPWAAAFAFLPLWLALTTAQSLRQVFLLSWLTQVILTLIGFNWVAHTVHEFGHLPWPVAILALLLFSTFANLHIPLAAVAWWLLRRWHGGGAGLSSLTCLVGTTILAELSYPMIFDWHFGYTWYWLGWPGVQISEWIGFQGLSALTIAANGLLLWAWLEPQMRRIVLTFFAAATLGIQGAGHFLRQRQVEKEKSGNLATVKVGIIQANIGNLEKQEAEKGDRFRESIVSTYLQLSQDLLRRGSADFLVWPETAVPDFLNAEFIANLPHAARVQAFVRDQNVPLITGGYSFNSQTQQVGNSIFILNRNGTEADSPYAKTHLLAFGEYLPGAIWFPKLKEWLPQVADFARGTGPRVMQLENLRIGPQVCYEGLFPGFSRRLARQGAQLIVNVTNDSWYGTWQQPWQHLYMTLARAMELRTPLIRSTNTGISTVALASGEVLSQSPLQTEWHQIYEIPYDPEPQMTVYVRFGFVFPYLLGLLLLTAGLAPGLMGQFRGQRRHATDAAI